MKCQLEKPADFSFMNFKKLKGTKPDTVHTTRIGTPATGESHKFLTRAVWLNNNRLTDIKYVDIFIESILEFPTALAWLDLSFNNIEEIDLSLLKFTNLRILYLHGNNISDVKELLKLKALKLLKTLTVHGNPVYSKKNYRQYLITMMPQIVNLDFTRITDIERNSATALQRVIE
ncbi:PREDICTED: leucine-rich repeat-containing protein 51-like [Nicrophorus vespilloides]|uniref:Leucine-rich repeat-containing protein 51 n=1 Tax=Nicrophorus vespilloides TaxID=110193 RepID=A0ABM1M5Q0_NICVS|nr:PREDICTED: leucine-rich repeat-containing protein 51-like [Nicrophorus vespilloides]